MATIDHVLSVDDFSNPKTLTGPDAINQLILKLLIMEPGSSQLHPEMGIGVISKYRYSDIDTAVDEMRNEIEKQMALYLPTLQGVTVDISVVNREYQFEIKANDTLYQYSTDSTSNTVELGLLKQ